MRNAFLVLILALLLIQVSYIVYRNSRPPEPPAKVVKKADDKKIDDSRTKKRSPDDVGDGIVRGFVYRADGAPAANCTVLLAKRPPAGKLIETIQRMPRWFERTDGTGRFVLDSLPPGAYTVLARTDHDHAVAMVSTRAAGAPADLMLWLRPSATFRGTVVDDAGSPVSGAMVFPLGPGARPFEILPAATGASGNFMFTYLPPGARSFLAVAGDNSTHVITNPIEPNVETNIVLGGGRRVQGALLDADTGKALARVKLQLMENDERLVTYTALTDAAGVFDFGMKFDTSYSLLLDSERYVFPSVHQDIDTRELVDGVELEVRAVRAARIRGRVMDASGRYGSEAQTVRATPLTDPMYLEDAVSVQTDMSGYYNLQGLAPLRYRISLTATHPHSLQSGVEEITLAPGEAASGPTWQLLSGTRISGNVVDADGAPVANASVRATEIPENPQPSASMQWIYHTRTDESGTFTLDALLPGIRLLIAAEHFDQSSRYFGPELLKEDGIENLTLTLDQPSSSAVSGHVKDAAGETVTHGMVAIYGDRDLPAIQWITVDRSGRFQFTRLPEGSYGLVWAQYPDNVVRAMQHRLDLNASEFRRDVVLQAR